MNCSTIARTLARGTLLFVVATLLAVLAVALQTAAPAVRAGPAYQPPTNNVYVIHAGAYVDINTPIGASPGPADDVNSGAANCTLRDAIGIVNAGATSGTVNGCTITTVGAPAGNIYRINLPIGGYTYTLNGAELLTTANTVYIVGDTAANTIIQANANTGVATYRVLRNNEATVELGNVTIRHGQCMGACAAVPNHGGGIYNQASTTTVDASTVSNNTADWDGGGIYNEGTLNVRNGSTIGGASAGNQAVNGGGIYNEWGGTTTVDASTVSANLGGGIWNSNGATLNVQNGSTVSTNTAGDGGGINNQLLGTTAVDASTVSANTATNDGGGIWNAGTLNVQNGSTIGGAGAGNQATGDGGGICNAFGGTTTVDASTVSANTANLGGGIYNNEAALNVQNSSTIGGAGAGNTAGLGGGGICNGMWWTGTVTVDASTVSANTAIWGGGIANFDTLNVQNGSVIGGAGEGNQATNNGGGISTGAGTTTVDASTVSANTAINGGGIYNGRTLNVQNGSTIGGAGEGNQADFGGGIFNFGGTTTVTGSRILYNTGTTDGGGVYNDRDEVGATSVTTSCIVGNSATSFFNNQAVQQTATGNWWGAATGPNTPGADTTGGNVDTSGFLAAPPIPGCSGPIYLPIIWATFH